MKSWIVAGVGSALPAAAAYYVTVASAANWSGAVCSLGRYAMKGVARPQELFTLDPG